LPQKSPLYNILIPPHYKNRQQASTSNASQSGEFSQQSGVNPPSSNQQAANQSQSAVTSQQESAGI